MKKKGMAKGGAMKKPIAMSKGSKLKMVEKGGKKVPFFAADGVGKMQAGGALKPRKKPASVVKPKARPGSKNKIDKETLVGNMTKAQVEKSIAKGKNPSKNKSNKSEVTSKKSRATKKVGKAVGNAALKAAKFLSPITGTTMAGAAAKQATKKMGGGMMKKKGMAKGGAMKKKGYAKGGVVKKGMGGSMKKKGMAKGGVARGSGAARPQKFTRNG